MRTAILARLTPALCEALTGRADAGEVLTGLSRGNLFVMPLDDCDEWFRYHRLLADTLRAELARRHPAEVPGLHRAAAAWMLQHGDLDGAIGHLLAAGDLDAAASVVASNWSRCWGRGQVETVRRWLEAFDESDVLARPELTLAAGWVFSAVGDEAQALHWTRAACSARVPDRPSPDGAVSLRSSQALLRATVAPDGVTAMRRDADLASELEAGAGSSWYVDACLARGVARWLGGAEQQAIRPLATALREGAVFNAPAELAAHGYLALLAEDSDEWEVARDYVQRARRRLAELGFGSSRRTLPLLLAAARLAAHDGQPADARTTARIDEVLGRLGPHVWARLLGEIVLGEVALTCGDLAEAQLRLAQAQRRLTEYGADAGVLQRRLERLRKAVERRRLADPLTAAELRVLELLPTHLTEAQIAEKLFVSRNTVKTHLRGLYRKLEASSRAQAVERARELGLLTA